MRRAGASPFYFFPRDYWEALASGVAARARRRARARPAARERARDGRAAVAALPPRRRRGRRARDRRQPPRALQPRLLGSRAGLRDAAPGRRRRRPRRTRCSSSSCASRPRGGWRSRSARRSTISPAICGSPAPRRSTGTRSSPATASPTESAAGALDRVAQPPREREAQLAPALLHEPQAEEVDVAHQLVVVVEPALLARRRPPAPRRRRPRSRAARARRPRARRRCAGRAGSSRASSARPRSC